MDNKKLKRYKYTAKIIKKEVVYVIADGGEIINGLTSFQKLSDGWNGEPRKYLLCELYSNVGMVQGNTLHELNDNTWLFASSNNLGYEFNLYIDKK